MFPSRVPACLLWQWALNPPPPPPLGGQFSTRRPVCPRGRTSQNLPALLITPKSEACGGRARRRSRRCSSQRRISARTRSRRFPWINWSTICFWGNRFSRYQHTHTHTRRGGGGHQNEGPQGLGRRKSPDLLSRWVLLMKVSLSHSSTHERSKLDSCPRLRCRCCLPKEPRKPCLLFLQLRFNSCEKKRSIFFSFWNIDGSNSFTSEV